MRSLLSLVMTVLALDMAVAQLPNCTDVGVHLCWNSNADDMCDDYCRSQGSVKTLCEIFDNSLRVTCQCASAEKGCFDVPEYNASDVPTCEEFGIYSCNNACTDICKSLKNTRGDEQGRDATCIAPGRSNTKCMCDGLALCDDAVNLGPTNSPTQGPDTFSGGDVVTSLLSLAVGGAATMLLLLG